jgi:hypothetical protein
MSQLGHAMDSYWVILCVLRWCLWASGGDRDEDPS